MAASKSRRAYYGAPPGWIGAARAGAVGRPARAAPRSQDRPAAARASAHAARLASHRTTTTGPRARRGRRCALLRARAARRPAHRHALRPRSISTTATPACAASSACSPSPRSTAPPPSTTPRTAALELRRPDLPLRPPLPRAPSAGAAHAAPGRSRSSASSPSTAISSIAATGDPT